MFVQTIVCFANSRKNSNRCVAGKTWSRAGRGDWIRPVCRGESRAIRPALLTYPDGAQPTPLDIVQIPVDAALPEGHQRENVLLSERHSWVKTGRLDWREIGDWLDAPRQLWTLNEQSRGMLNNRVSSGRVTGSSLQLISVPTLHLRQVEMARPHAPPARVVVGEFVYHGVSYRLHVTDTLIEDLCRHQRSGMMNISRAVLCVSLGECFLENHYKLIAGVLFEGRST